MNCCYSERYVTSRIHIWTTCKECARIGEKGQVFHIWPSCISNVWNIVLVMFQQNNFRCKCVCVCVCLWEISCFSTITRNAPLVMVGGTASVLSQHYLRPLRTENCHFTDQKKLPNNYLLRHGAIRCPVLYNTLLANSRIQQFRLDCAYNFEACP